MKHAGFIFALLLPLALFAQSPVPAGTILPVRLETSLNAQKLRPDQRIHARVMQNIPGTSIHRGAQLLGHIVSATPGTITLRFDTLLQHGRRIHLTSNLRALASMLEVEEAQIPEGAPSRGLPPEDWNTRQIGGDQVYRGGGPVMQGMTVVGVPTPYGVRGQLAASGRCRAAVDGNSRPQALWLFSTNACGVYGIPGLTILHAGRTNPTGAIQLASTSGKLQIRSGSALLLRVQGS